MKYMHINNCEYYINNINDNLNTIINIKSNIKSNKEILTNDTIKEGLCINNKSNDHPHNINVNIINLIAQLNSIKIDIDENQIDQINFHQFDDQSINIFIKKINKNIEVIIMQLEKIQTNNYDNSVSNLSNLSNLVNNSNYSVKDFKQNYIKENKIQDDDFSNFISCNNSEKVNKAVENLSEEQILHMLEKLKHNTSIETNRISGAPEMDSVYHCIGDPMDKITTIMDDDEQDKLVKIMAEKREKLEYCEKL
jgi:hypothetical protein